MSLDPILATEIEAIPLGLPTVALVAVPVVRSTAVAGSFDHPGRAEG